MNETASPAHLELLLPQLEQILGASRHAVFVKDAELRYILVSPDVVRVFGVAPSEMIGHTDQELFGTVVGTHMAEVDRRVLAGEIVEEEHCRSIAGARATFHVVRVPLRRADGEQHGLCGVVHDISEQRLLQAELRDTREQLTSMLERTPQVVVEVGLDGKLRYANPYCLELFGATRGQVIGHDLLEFIPPAERQQALMMRGLALENSDRFVEQRFISVDDREIWLRSSARPALKNGQIDGLFMIGTDITQLKQAERQRHRDRQEFEQFAAALAHDLRAPLHVIEGFGRALTEEYGAQLQDGGLSYLQRMRSACRRTCDMVDALLDLARATSATIEPANVDLSRLSKSIALDLSATHPDNRVQLHVEPGLHAQGDGQLLRVVLSNLLDNAYKFSAAAEQPEVRVGRSQLHDNNSFFVQDNGVGFDPAEARTLFSPFGRLHSASEFPGHGIGLATVRRIIERHGGQVSASSQPGQGATFTFTLQAAPKDPGSPEL